MRRLEKSRVGGGYEVPAKRVEVGRENVRGVKTLGGKMLPVRFRQDLGVSLTLPEYGQVLTLGVILQAGKIDERLFP